MQSVLLVDDSAIDRKVMTSIILERMPQCEVRTAANADEAKLQIEESPPDLMVTDLIMPGKSGWELIEDCRRKFPSIPIVLLTAHGNEAAAVSALERGAASYVAKEDARLLLVDTLQTVLNRAHSAHYRRRLWGYFSEIDDRLELENDPRLVPPFIDYIQQRLAGIWKAPTTELIRVGIAVEEALWNALYHGNLELNREEARSLRDSPGQKASRGNASSNSARNALAERLRQPPFRDRRVHIHLHLTPAHARVTIRDEGPGFNTGAEYSRATSAECLEKARGLTLVHTLMDEVHFAGGGNEIVMTKWSAAAKDELAGEIARRSQTPNEPVDLMSFLLRRADGREPGAEHDT